MTCYCGLFGCATGCGLTGCINPCGFLQLVPGPVGLVSRMLCHNWGDLSSLSDGGQLFPDPPVKPEPPEKPQNDDCTTPELSILVMETCPFEKKRGLPTCTAIATRIEQACSSTVSTTTEYCSTALVTNSVFICPGK